MMKPSDNLRHQLLKYLEDQANRTSSTITAPPPYTTNPLNTNNLPNTIQPRMIYIPNSMYNHEDYDWDEPTPAATSITIDSSFSINGDENTVSVSSPRVGVLANDATNQSKETTNAKDMENDQEQIAQLAASLINAIKAQDLTEESGHMRPITVELKCGIVIKGVGNKLCIGDAYLASTVSRRTHSEPETPDKGVEENAEANHGDGIQPPVKSRYFY